MFNEWERKDFRSAEKKQPPREVNKEKTSFWPADDFSVRGPEKTSKPCQRGMMGCAGPHQKDGNC
jgi:hypothetical protein